MQPSRVVLALAVAEVLEKEKALARKAAARL